MKFNRRLSLLWLLLLALTAPYPAHASDMTGALGVFMAGLAILAGVAGLFTAAILRWKFKRARYVWLLILLFPVLAFSSFVAYLIFQPVDKNYKEGPDFPSNGGPTATVSPGFGKTDLTRLYGQIESPLFKRELARHTQEPLSNYIFQVTLTVPPSREERHYVTFYVYPEVTNRQTDEAMSDLFHYLVERGTFPAESNAPSQAVK